MVALALLVSSILVADPAASLVFRNNTGETIRLWFRPESERTWRQPLLLSRRGSARVEFMDLGRHEVVLRDLLKRDERLGIWDFGTVKRQAPDAEILVNYFYEQRSREVQYTVMVPVQETRVDAYGNSYTVTKYVPETRTRTVDYTVRIPQLTVKTEGQLIAIHRLQPQNVGAEETAPATEAAAPAEP